MFRSLVAVVICLGLIGPLSAATWADGTFTELSKDFGSVPRGPTLEHYFHLTNNTSQTIHISGVRVSCGCTTATVLESTIAPGQSTAVVARMDTNRFTGVRTVTLFVSFDRPVAEEVRLWVQANARDDVSVTPDSFQFGQVKRGATPSAMVRIAFLGPTAGQITGISSESNYIVTSLKEARRDANGVEYQLSATLRADAPIGKWYTDIWLKTSNPATARVRVPFTVEIESALSVTPSLVDLGQLKSGARTERKIIVRGVKPFRITTIQGTDADLAVTESSADSKPIHILTVTLTARTPGEVKRRLRIITDLADEGEIEFGTKGQVVP